MTIDEFEKNYSLHDSELIDLEYNAESHTAIITIELDSSESKLIAVKFQNVSKLKYDDKKGHSDFGNTILETQIDENNSLIFKQIDDANFDYYETIIKAENVEVEELKSNDK